jgi:hypothetical protein
MVALTTKDCGGTGTRERDIYPRDEETANILSLKVYKHGHHYNLHSCSKGREGSLSKSNSTSDPYTVKPQI